MRFSGLALGMFLLPVQFGEILSSHFALSFVVSSCVSVSGELKLRTVSCLVERFSFKFAELVLGVDVHEIVVDAVQNVP